MSVYFPQNSSNNLGSALALWNQFNQPPKLPSPNGTPQTPAVPDLSPAEKPNTWDDPNAPWQGSSTTNQVGKGIAADSNSGNMGKAAAGAGAASALGAGGGAAGLLAAM